MTDYKRGKFNFEAPVVNGRPAPYRHVGKYRVRADARDIVTGKCLFLDDFSVPRMIYAQVLRSPTPTPASNASTRRRLWP